MRKYIRGKLNDLFGIGSSFAKNAKESHEKRLKEQIQIYKEVGLDSTRDEVIKKLNECLRSIDLPPYDEDIGMYSEHLVILAALSFQKSFNPKNILEIGTYDGRCACALARLFPECKVTTLDLKDDDPMFDGTYGRNNAESKNLFIESRTAHLEKHPNVSFVQTNSLALSRDTKNKYDLIWIDGAHGYPIVCSDITNSIRILEDNGIMMCDDVYIESKNNDQMYKSIAAWQTLQAFKQAGLISVVLFRKRLGSRHLSSEKFISLSKLSHQ